jgi:hypothetical protein
LLKKEGKLKKVSASGEGSLTAKYNRKNYYQGIVIPWKQKKVKKKSNNYLG